MRMRVGEVRKPFLIALSLAMVAAVALPTFWHVQHVRDRRANDRMQKIARSITAPAPMTALVLHHDCNGTGLVYCGWTTDSDLDSLLQTVAKEVSLKAGTKPRVACWTSPGVNGHGKSCMVQVLDGDRGVSFFVEPYVRQVDGRSKVLGTEYTVQTS
jgi:hypothetical protein